MVNKLPPAKQKTAKPKQERVIKNFVSAATHSQCFIFKERSRNLSETYSQTDRQQRKKTVVRSVAFQCYHSLKSAWSFSDLFFFFFFFFKVLFCLPTLLPIWTDSDKALNGQQLQPRVSTKHFLNKNVFLWFLINRFTVCLKVKSRQKK